VDIDNDRRNKIRVRLEVDWGRLEVDWGRLEADLLQICCRMISYAMKMYCIYNASTSYWIVW